MGSELDATTPIRSVLSTPFYRRPPTSRIPAFDAGETHLM